MPYLPSDTTVVFDMTQAEAKLSAITNWQALGANETTAIVAPNAQALSVVDPDAAVAGATAGSGAGAVPLSEMQFNTLKITATLSAEIVLVQKATIEDADAMGLNLTEHINRHLAAKIAKTHDLKVMTGLRNGADEVEYDGDIVEALSDMLAAFEDEGIEATHFVLDLKAKRLVRNAKDTTGQPIFADSLTQDMPATLMGLPVVFVAGVFGTDELGMAVNSDYIHAGVRVMGDVQTLEENYAEADAIGFKARTRQGVTVLMHNGTFQPCVLLVDKV